MGALDNDPILNIPPPLYALGMDFKYSSRSILTDGNGLDVLIDPSSSPDDNEVIDIVKCRTFLDRGQYQAVAYCYLTYPIIVTRALRIGPTGSPVKISGGAREQLCVKFFKLRITFVATCKIENLPRLAAKGILTGAKEPCQQKCQNAEVLGDAVDETLSMLGKEWDEEATPEEIAAIKAARVSARGGIATHSGHWDSRICNFLELVVN
ncbi:hypothetical protein BGZ57DRAFT_921322 [Hyaloscypha finlandica]|nr:hypothetical protein BGZ57DRAFT_921322 [Hyaloscypha finlandica]